MSIIKQLATYDGSTWTTDDIGANASNVSLTTNVAGQTNVQSALSKIVGTSALTADRAVITGTGGVLSTSTVTNTELSYLSGATSNLQGQIDTLNNNLDNKVNTSVYNSKINEIEENLLATPAARFLGSCPTQRSSSMPTGTWYYVSSFPDSTSSHWFSNDSYFSSDTNGIKFLKGGYYKITYNVYFNTSITGLDIGADVFNYTTSSTIISPRYHNCSNRTWGFIVCDTIAGVPANTVILPRFQIYAGTGLAKPTNVYFLVELVTPY